MISQEHGQNEAAMKCDEAIDMSREVSPVQEIAAPVVFQCSHCKTIVGDSSSIAHMDTERRTMSIKRKPDSIEVDPVLNTSTRDYDFGSTYQYFKCVQCKNVIGQVYITTSAKLDHMRELFTYHSEQLFFYQLCPDPDVAVPECPTDGTTGMEEKMPEEPAASITVGPTVTSLPSPGIMNQELEIVKLQKFCLYLLEKVQKLEAWRSKRKA